MFNKVTDYFFHRSYNSTYQLIKHEKMIWYNQIIVMTLKLDRNQAKLINFYVIIIQTLATKSGTDGF